jgi:hypothetical protein
VADVQRAAVEKLQQIDKAVARAFHDGESKLPKLLVPVVVVGGQFPLQPKCVIVVCGSGTSLTPGLDGLNVDHFERRQYTVSRLPDAAALKRASTALA